jgi:hypothetical protein
VLAAIAWIAPRVLVLTALRDRPLQAAFAGIDGSVSSGAAVWGWLGGIEYRDILLRDRTGRALVAVPRLLVDRSLAQLVIDPRNLGTVRLVGAEALIDVRAGGSSLEDVLAPWLATFGRSPDADPPTCEIELVDGAVEFRDLVRGDAWRLTELCAAGAVSAVGPASAWTVAGRVRRAAPRAADTAADPAPDSAAADAARLDRATLAARATAALARDGGFSLSASEGDAAARSVTLSAHRLPLGVSALSATRFGGSWVADGLADVRLDLAAGAAGPRLVGSVAVENLAVCRAATLEELLTLARVEVPLDCGFADGRLLIHRLSIDSPIFHAQASGRIRLPTGGTWDWAEAMIEDDFAVAASWPPRPMPTATTGCSRRGSPPATWRPCRAWPPPARMPRIGSCGGANPAPPSCAAGGRPVPACGSRTRGSYHPRSSWPWPATRCPPRSRGRSTSARRPASSPKCSTSAA